MSNSSQSSTTLAPPGTATTLAPLTPSRRSSRPRSSPGHFMAAGFTIQSPSCPITQTIDTTDVDNFQKEREAALAQQAGARLPQKRKHVTAPPSSPTPSARSHTTAPPKAKRVRTAKQAPRPKASGGRSARKETASQDETPQSILGEETDVGSSEKNDSDAEDETRSTSKRQRDLRKNSSDCELYFKFLEYTETKEGKKLERLSCLHCESPIGKHSTTSLKNHRKKCPGLAEAWKNRAPGAIPPKGCEDVIRQAPEKKVFHRFWVDFLIKNGLPFALSDDPLLQQMIRYLDPTIDPPCRDTAAKLANKRYLEGLDILKKLISKLTTPVGWSTDAWTSADMANSYLGIIVSLVDSEFHYHEYLLDFSPISGSHTGRHMAEFLAEKLRSLLDVTLIGPPTSDNASNNKAAFEKLDDIIGDDDYTFQSISGRWHRCVNHVFALIVKDYLAAINNLSPEQLLALTYGSNTAGIAFHIQSDPSDQPTPPGTPGDISSAVPPPNLQSDVTDPVNNATPLDVIDHIDEDWVRLLQDIEPSETQDIDEEEDNDLGLLASEKNDLGLSAREKRASLKQKRKDLAARNKVLRALKTSQSPVGLLRRIVVHIRSSSVRQDIFYRQCIALGLKPLKPSMDVPTRWNSTLAMILRALDIEKAIDAYCALKQKDGCPELSQSDWNTLRSIKELLNVFGELTDKYSKREPLLQEVLYDYMTVRSKLKTQKALVDGFEWSLAMDGVMAKITKYIDLAMANDYVIMATALNPRFGLVFAERMISRAGHADRASALRDIIRKELDRIAPPPVVEASTTSNSDLDPNDEMAQFVLPESIDLPEDEIETYISISKAGRPKDSILSFWRRQSLTLPRLSLLARHVLSVQATSTSVERLFSGASRVATINRPNLRPETIKKLVSTMEWMKCGILDAGA